MILSSPRTQGQGHTVKARFKRTKRTALPPRIPEGSDIGNPGLRWARAAPRVGNGGGEVARGGQGTRSSRHKYSWQGRAETYGSALCPNSAVLRLRDHVDIGNLPAVAAGPGELAAGDVSRSQATLLTMTEVNTRKPSRCVAGSGQFHAVAAQVAEVLT